MSDLPTREEAHRICLDFGVSSTTIIVGAYADGTLMTEAEWRDSLPSLNSLPQHRPYLDHLIQYAGSCGARCDPEINQHAETCVIAGVLSDLKWWMDAALGEQP